MYGYSTVRKISRPTVSSSSRGLGGGLSRPTVSSSPRGLGVRHGPAYVTHSAGAVRRHMAGSFRNTSTRRPRTRGAGSLQTERSIGADARHGARSSHEDDVYRPIMPSSQPTNSLFSDNDEQSSGDPVDDTSDDLNSGNNVEEEGQGTHVRGENTSHERIILNLHGDDLFHPKTGTWMHTQLPREMTLSMKGRISGDWPSWSAVPPGVKKLMCREWMAKFNFNEDEKPRAQAVFYKNASKRMSSFMYDARKRAIRACNASNLSQCIKSGRPTWLDQTVWTRLILMHWATDEFTLKSSKARDSRNTPVNGKSSRHTGGSVPFEITQKRLSVAKKKPVGFVEVFDKTHKHADGEFVDNRSKEKSAAYRAAMKEKYSSNEDDWPYIDEDIYLETVGPPKKGRYYGLGSSGASNIRQTSQTDSSSHDGIANGSRTAGLGIDLEQVMAHITDLHKRMDEFTQQMRTEVEKRYATSSSVDAAIVDEARRQSLHDIEAFKNEIQAVMDDKLKKLEDTRRADEEQREQSRVQEKKERDEEQKRRDAEFMSKMRDMFRSEIRSELGRSQSSQQEQE